MGGKINWQKARPGRGGFDERTGTEWSRGASDIDLLCDDDSMLLPPDMLRPPDAFWQTKMTRLFPEKTDDAIRKVQALAGKAAAELYRLHSVDTLVARIEAFYDKASRGNPFPCQWFAGYFDLAARRIALGRKVHDPAPRRSLDKFFGIHSAYARMLRAKELVEHAGGAEALWQTGKPKKNQHQRLIIPLDPVRER